MAQNDIYDFERKQTGSKHAAASLVSDLFVINSIIPHHF